MIGEALLKEADRVADRLRVVLPRLLGRQDDTAGRELLGETRAVLQRLADAAASAQGRSHGAVPEIGVHAVPDQVLVLAYDVVTGTPEPGTFATGSAAAAAHEQALADGVLALQELRSRL